MKRTSVDPDQIPRWNRGRPRRVAIQLAILLAVGGGFIRGEVAEGKRGIISTVHPIATEAGMQAFRNGGNAIDAAVAAALMLGVVDGYNSGIGGGCLMLIRLASGKVAAIDGREMAPMAAHRDLYVRNGRVDPQLSQTGPLAVAVPGALMAYSHAVNVYGRLSLSEPLLRAAQVAERGFRIDPSYAARLKSEAPELNQFEGSRAIFFRPDGRVLQEGDLLRQPDLAQSYRAIAAHGIGWFYYGPFALAAGEWIVYHGGILNALDFAYYQIRLREPVVTTYRDHTILGFPPPSSGGVHVGQILNILENFDLKSMQSNRVETVHVVAEAMRLAFADRAHWLGDADFAPVPRGLVAKSYAASLAKRIKRDQAASIEKHGTPGAKARETFGKHTTHFTAADAAGNWVACTATINTTFGSKVVIPGTGVVMNNQMDDFSSQPGVPNSFGLIGAEANSIAPRKRPLSSMSPTIVLKEGRPVFSLGAAGGPTIISQVVLALINWIDYGMDLETALGQPRFHHQWLPNELKVEAKMSQEIMEGLQARGHKIEVVNRFGATQAIALNKDKNGFEGAHDPRNQGKAQGW